MKYLLAAGLVGLFFRFSGPLRKRSGDRPKPSGNTAKNAAGNTAKNAAPAWRRFVPHIGQVSAIMLTIVWLIAMGFLLFVV